MNYFSELCERSVKLGQGSDIEIVEKARALGWSAEELDRLNAIYGPAMAMDWERSCLEATNRCQRETGK